MSVNLLLLFLACVIVSSKALYCFECSADSANHRSSGAGCAGRFAPVPQFFNNTKDFIVNCTEDNSMCFLRAWQSRVTYAWIVQRGCYQLDDDDDFADSFVTPNGSMSCVRFRLPQAEYKVCLCKDDWCNKSTNKMASISDITFITAVGYLIGNLCFYI